MQGSKSHYAHVLLGGEQLALRDEVVEAESDLELDMVEDSIDDRVV